VQWMNKIIRLSSLHVIVIIPLSKRWRMALSRNILESCTLPGHLATTSRNRKVASQIIYRAKKQDICLSETQCPLMRRFKIIFIFWPGRMTGHLDLSPLKMCCSMRYTCMPNMKLLSSILQKLWQNFNIY